MVNSLLDDRGEPRLSFDVYAVNAAGGGLISYSTSPVAAARTGRMTVGTAAAPAHLRGPCRRLRWLMHTASASFGTSVRCDRGRATSRSTARYRLMSLSGYIAD